MKYRYYLDKLIEEKNNNKISIILGPRQAGKTTVLKEIHKQLGGVFLDIDIYSNYEKISTYENFIDYLVINGYKKEQPGQFYVFLDEFQRYASITNILKNVYDHHKNVKIYATGSSSLEIKNNIQESLAGRKRITNFYPLSFKEFLIFKDRKDLLDKINNLREIINNKNYSKLVPDVIDYFNEFIIYGGYPEVALLKKQEHKKEALRGIFDLYIKKDLVDFLDNKKIHNTQLLIKQLAINNGSLANYSNYSKKSETDIRSIKNLINILKETFIIIKLLPFYSNKSKEIVKAPKIYFFDNGVRNYFINNFNKVDIRSDIGELFENFCITEIIKAGEPLENMKYYRTKMGREVDIIIDRVQKIIPLEVKYKTNIKKSDQRNIEAFTQEYNTDDGFLVNMGEINFDKKIKKIDCFSFEKRLKM